MAEEDSKPAAPALIEDSSDDDDAIDANALDGGADEEWEEAMVSDDDDGGDGEPTRSLFDNTILPSPDGAMDYDAQHHGFDLRQFATKAHLSDYGVIQVINYIRTEVAAGRDCKASLVGSTDPSTAPWSQEQYLIPPRPDDALLCYDFEEWTCDAAGSSADPSSTAGATSQPSSQPASSDLSELATLRLENRALQAEVSQLHGALVLLRGAMLSATGLLQEAGTGEAEAGASASDRENNDSSSAARGSGAPSTSSRTNQQATAGGPHRPGAARQRAAGKGAVEKEVDESYFDSYSGLNIHKEMLSDKPRTDAYRAALEGNPALIKDKVVLDVGCGTGILSLFACRAGARQVVAVDGSERIAGFARQIATQAGYGAEAGGPMHVVCAKLEELQALPGGATKVDVIVSEWMGYALLFETMLDSVLAARDRWLAPGGVVLPDIATIYLAGVNSEALGLGFWKDVYGFSMEPIAAELRQAQLQRANVLAVEAAHVTTHAVTAKVLDLCTMKSEDQDFTCEFDLQPVNDTSCVEVAAIALWFDTDFSAQRCRETPVKLSTSPSAPSTHWVQTLLPLRETLTLAGSSVALSPAAPHAARITGRLSMGRNRSKHRSLDIAVQYSAQLSDGSTVSNTCIYPMNVLD